MGRLDRLAADHRTLSRRFRRRTGGGERRGRRGAPAGLPRPAVRRRRQAHRSDRCVPLSVAGVERAGSAGGFRVDGKHRALIARSARRSGRLIMRGYDRRGRLDRGVGGTGTVAVSLPGDPRRLRASRGSRTGSSWWWGPSGTTFRTRSGRVRRSLLSRRSLDGVRQRRCRDHRSGSALRGGGQGRGRSADGRLVVAASGRFESGVLYPKRSTDLVVLRYTSAGTLDPDFASAACCTCRQNPMARTSSPPASCRAATARSSSAATPASPIATTTPAPSPRFAPTARSTGSCGSPASGPAPGCRSMRGEAHLPRRSMPRMRDGLENVMSV